jgi:heat-inducible transcriptional repressor
MIRNAPLAHPSALSLAQLSERAREIFRHIVDSYLASGDPVGSRNLARLLPMTLSPARCAMSCRIWRSFLIYAPHTSAGRLPTELGLRFFVDPMLQIATLRRMSARASPPKLKRLPKTMIFQASWRKRRVCCLA